MSQYSFTAEQRSEFRKALTSSPAWDLYRTVNNITASAMSVDDMLTAAAELGVNPADYGTEKNAPKQTRKKDVSQVLRDLQEMLSETTDGISEERVLELIKTHALTPQTVTIELRTPAGLYKTQTGQLIHYKTPLLLAAVSAGVNVMLVGPAGSGKTTAAHMAADALGVPFYFTGAIDSAYKLTGFVDAQGRTVRTAFREAYEHGGVFLFDEMDGSLPSAVLAFNAALANGHADFPDGIVPRHKNFRAIAACNTFGNGASRQYVGRLQLDAASLDRFATMTWDYDVALESALIGAPKPETAPKPINVFPLSEESAQKNAVRWFETVLKTREKIESHKIRHVVSPRATIMGSRLLAAGWPLSEVMESVLYKGLDSDSRSLIAV